MEESLNTPVRGDRPVGLGNVTARAAMPARYVLERADWAGAAALAVTPSKFPQADSLTRFVRGLGMARSGDLSGAKREIEAMRALQSALRTSAQSYWADRTEEQILAVSAWVALAEGARDQAVQSMRAAADGEDSSIKHVAMENRLYPMRELLADLLLETGQAASALREYRASLKATPNRYRGIYGAALAAETAGERRTAADYFGKLVALSRNADTVRPELARAKTFLASL
jgi:tetratricopeptide (TPR) repeat protein